MRGRRSCAGRLGIVLAAMAGPGHGSMREVPLKPGHVTTVRLDAAAFPTRWVLGSDLAEVLPDAEAGLLHLVPRGAAGETNLQLVAGERLRSLRLVVDPAIDASALVVDLRATAGPDVGGGPADESRLALAPPLPPDDLPVAEAWRVLRDLDRDPRAAAAWPDWSVSAADWTGRWHGCPVRLRRVAQFAPLDLVVAEVEWSNPTDWIVTLPAHAVDLTAGGRAIPKTAWLVGAEELAPGGVDRWWILVQGLRLSRDNRFGLQLPAEESVGEGTP